MSLVGNNKGLSAVRIVVVNKCYKDKSVLSVGFPHTAACVSACKQRCMAVHYAETVLRHI